MDMCLPANLTATRDVMKTRRRCIIALLALIVAPLFLSFIFGTRSGCVVGQFIRNVRYINREGILHGGQWSGNLIEGHYIARVQANNDDVKHYHVFEKNAYSHYLQVEGGCAVHANGNKVTSEDNVMLEYGGHGEWTLTMFRLDHPEFVEIKTTGELANFVAGRKVRITRSMK